MAKAPVDIDVKVNGLSDFEKLAKRMFALEKEVGRLQGKLPAAANGIKSTGRAAKGAAGGVTAFGAALKSAVAPLTLVLGSVTSLTAGFQVLSKQNFAEAKFRSLGGSSKELVANLKKLSRELKGQASTAELTGAAYDVASAGFGKASDATKVLKAASLGATGGFSDINTVANATTSVLNAYGLSADKAGRLVDGFIQTQNDGKIVIGEYANNIGKLAPIAASLGVPLEDINGAIAAVTANGVNAEIGITALRSALAKLGANSKDATGLLASYGVEINATTIGQEGLLKTLEKLSKVTDKTDLLKIIGTEAGQAIAPLLNDLGKLERLIENQGNVAGVAANAQKQSAQTIQGAWTEVSTAFSNLFSEQSELAEAIIPILQGVAAAVEALNSPLGGAILQIGLVTAGFIALNAAVSALVATSFVQWFLPIVGAVKAGNLVFAAFILKTKALTVAQAALNSVMLLNPWVALAAGLTAVGVAAVNASQKISNMRAKMNDTSGSVQTLRSRMVDIQNEIARVEENMEGAGNSSRGMKRKVEELKAALENLKGVYDVEIALRAFLDTSGVDTASLDAGFFGPAGGAIKPKEKPKPTVTTPTGGGSSGGGAAPRESELPQLQRQLQVSDKLLQIDRARLEAQFNGNEKEIQRLANLRVMTELEGKRAEIAAEEIPVAEQKVKEQLAENEAALAGLEIKYQSKELDKQRQEAVQGILAPLGEEIQLLQARINGNEEEIKQNLEILRIKKAIKEARPEEDTSGVAEMVKQRDALKEQAEAADKLKAQYKQLANSIAGELTGAFKSIIDGSKSAEEALSDAFAGIADAFLDMAMKMIQEWIKMQLIGLVGSLFGPAASPVSGSGGMFAPGGSLGNFGTGISIAGLASGGPAKEGIPYLVGERGPELVVPSSNSQVIPNSAVPFEMGGGSSSSNLSVPFSNSSSVSRIERSNRETVEAMANPGSLDVKFDSQVINNVEYVTAAQHREGMAQAAERGRSLTLSTMQNSVKTRRRVGI